MAAKQTTTVSMKLLIDSNGKRVLFAEASKECVDFLFYILSLPIATIIRLLGKKKMVGSLANLYQSIENLNESYMQPNQTKDSVLKPVCLLPGSSLPLLLPQGDGSDDNKFFRCNGGCLTYVSLNSTSLCPQCKRYNMSMAMKHMAPTLTQAASGDGGFVKGVVTYMVIDDLVVTPMSIISSIALLNKFNVKDVGALEERVVNLGMDEAVNLLSASLEVKNVLTHVFFGSKNK